MPGKIQKFRGRAEVPPKEFYPDWDNLRDVNLQDDKLDFFEYNMPEMQKAIKLFWWCSLTGRWEWFDFDAALEAAEGSLKQRIAEEDLPLITMQAIDDGHFDHKKLGIDIEYSMSNPDTRDDIWEQVEDKLTRLDLTASEWKALEELHCAEGAKDVWSRGIKFFRRLNSMNNPTLCEKISLFDSIIDIYHESGNYWGVDTPKMRKEFEKECSQILL